MGSRACGNVIRELPLYFHTDTIMSVDCPMVTVLLLVCGGSVISAVRSDPGPSWCYLPLHVDREPCLRLSACIG